MGASLRLNRRDYQTPVRSTVRFDWTSLFLAQQKSQPNGEAMPWVRWYLYLLLCSSYLLWELAPSTALVDPVLLIVPDLCVWPIWPGHFSFGMERIELCGRDNWSGVSKASRLQDVQWIGGTVWRRGRFDQHQHGSPEVTILLRSFHSKLSRVDREQTSQKLVFASFSIAVLAPMFVREADVYKHH